VSYGPTCSACAQDEYGLNFFVTDFHRTLRLIK
jgi:hypothetical protein